MEKTFEGMTKNEFIEYFNDEDTMEFANFYECSYDADDDSVTVWNTYDHNNCDCYDIDEFFKMYGK